MILESIRDLCFTGFKEFSLDVPLVKQVESVELKDPDKLEYFLGFCEKVIADSKDSPKVNLRALYYAFYGECIYFSMLCKKDSAGKRKNERIPTLKDKTQHVINACKYLSDISGIKKFSSDINEIDAFSELMTWVLEERLSRMIMKNMNLSNLNF